MLNIAINGFGRIGRNALRAYFENQLQGQFNVVAINDLSPIETNAHVFKYDTTHGVFAGEVLVEADSLSVNGRSISVLQERDPSKLPWAALNVDLVMECTGLFTARDAAYQHIQAGAKKVLVSAPGKDMDATIVYGVNSQLLLPSHEIVSNASCTTNCLAPIARVLHDAFGIEGGLANTVHAFTNDQQLIDNQHSDLRRARAAGSSMIPSKTGAAAAIGLVIPELDGVLDGLAVRVPVLNVSLLDLTVNLASSASVDEVNQVLIEGAAAMSAGVMQINDVPLVSTDFNHNSASSIVDITQTRVKGNMVKVLAWYDNEWGFSNRMLDTARQMLASISCDSAQAA